nr:MAG: capsid protein [Wufeng shrew picorna-like virus 26]
MSVLENASISSGDDGNVPSHPSNTIIPGPPTSEIAKHTHHLNSIDRQIYEQNIFKSTVVWSTSDPPGKLLAWWALTPESINSLVGHLSKMFKCWKGGMKVLLKVHGSAFHAGMASAVALPPDELPEKASIGRRWTAYNWHGVDPKSTDTIEIIVPDICQGAFHYIEKDNEGISSLTVGGYFALYVDSPLNTTTSGTQQIHIEMWCKPAEDFRMTYLQLPRTINPPARDTVAEKFALALSANAYSPSRAIMQAAYPYAVSSLHIHPSSVKKLVKGWAGSIYNNKGVVYNRAMQYSNQFYVTGKVTKMVEVTNTKRTVTLDSAFFMQYDLKNNAQRGVVSLSIPGESGWWQATYDSMDKNTSGMVEFGLIGDVDAVLKWKVGMTVIAFMPAWANMVDQKEHEPEDPLVAPIEESFITFTAQYNSKLDSMQTVPFRQAMITAIENNWWPLNQVGVFVVYDSKEGIPLMKIKVYPEGFITTAASADERFISFVHLQTVFESFIPRTSPIKYTPIMKFNLKSRAFKLNKLPTIAEEIEGSSM